MPVHQTNAEAVDPLVGTLLADRYKVLSVIGRGGMGVVYKARHEMMDRTVAIKMLLSQLVTDETSVKRFKREAHAASRINHPNIIVLHDFGITPTGLPFLVMDYLDGVSLAEELKKQGQLGVVRSIHIFTQVCDALEHAHFQGIIHRDLKPGNIMLVNNNEERDLVKVVDFGVAKLVSFHDEESQRLTQTGEVFGSPVYMSPEQCMESRLDARSDIYGLGVVIYETLTGKLPHLGKNVVETVSKHMHEIPLSFSEVRPDLYFPEALEAAVFRALQKDPNKRQQTMLELKDELLAALPASGKISHENRSSKHSLNLPRHSSAYGVLVKDNIVRPNTWLMLVIALVVGVLLVVSFIFFKQDKQQSLTYPQTPQQSLRKAAPVVFDKTSIKLPKSLARSPREESQESPKTSLPKARAIFEKRSEVRRKKTRADIIIRKEPAIKKQGNSTPGSTSPAYATPEHTPYSSSDIIHSSARPGRKPRTEEQIIYDLQAREGKWSSSKHWDAPIAGSRLDEGH